MTMRDRTVTQVTGSLYDGPACRLCGRRPVAADGLCGWCVKGHAPHFDGTTYAPRQDYARLTTQLDAVRELMLDGAWRTLPEIHAGTNRHGMEAAISARLRDLRKAKFGAYCVESRRRAGGLWEYRVRRAAHGVKL